MNIENVRFEDLPFEWQVLIEKAKKARKNAYAPYSKYQVGAAVLSTNNNYGIGCNIETATWSGTKHAEQVAISNLIAEYGDREIKALAVYTKDGGFPCAECRQFIWEFCNGNHKVIILAIDLKSHIKITTIGELYPERFGPENLK